MGETARLEQVSLPEYGSSGEAAGPFNEMSPRDDASPCLEQSSLPSVQKIPFSSPVSTSRNSGRLSWVSDRIITPLRLFGTSKKAEDTSKVLEDGETPPSLFSSPPSGRDCPENVNGFQASSSASSPSRNGGRISWSIKPKSLFGTPKEAQYTQKEPAAPKDLAEQKQTTEVKQDLEPPPPLSARAVSTTVSTAFLNLLRSP